MMSRTDIDRPIIFQSPTHGPLSFVSVLQAIGSYMAHGPASRYEVAIGTDSEVCLRMGEVMHIEYVTAVTVRRVGNGGVFFYHRVVDQKPKGWPLRERIYTETMHSVTLAQEIRSHLRDTMGNDVVDQILQLHVDVGENGPTRAMIGEVTGIARGYGFAVKIKPDAYCAAAVADRCV